jgi:polysaccharide biosynthesis transport protein
MEITQVSEIQRYASILKRRWLPAAIVCGSVVVLTGLYTFLQSPVYEAESQLLIKNNDSSSQLTGLTEALGQVNPLGKLSNPIDTESTILRSTPLVQEVITKQNLRSPKDGTPLKVEDFLLNLRVVNVQSTDVLSVLYRDTDSKRAQAVVADLTKFYIDNNVEKNRAAAAAARNFLEEQLPKVEKTVKQAEINLRKFKEENQIVDLVHEGEAAVTVISNLENGISTARGESQGVSAQSQALQAKLGMNSQEALTLVSLSQSPGVQVVLEQIRTIEDDLAVQRTRYQESSPAIVNLKSKLESLQTLLQSRIQQVLGRKGGKSRLQMGALEQSLVQDLVKTEVERLGINSKINALVQVQRAYQQRVTVLPKLEQGQRELDRRLKAAQTTYETLLQKLQEIRVAESLDVGNVSVVAPSRVPAEPVSPKKLLNMIAGALAGIVLGWLVALGLELRDRSIKTIDEALLCFGYPLLGSIPTFKPRVALGSQVRNLLPGIPRFLPASPEETPKILPVQLVVRDLPRAIPSEAFRMLLTNLNFLRSDNKVKIIVVTSCLPGEGKTTVSANLALCMHQLGRKVLLIDADLRRPSLHLGFGVSNQVGLSNVLVGDEEFETSVVEIGPDFRFLPSGQAPPNPIALLDSKRMADLLKEHASQYDFLVIDTPPMSLTAESMILAAMGDGVLLVTRPGVIDSQTILKNRRYLERALPNKVLGVVVNGVIQGNESYQAYYQYAQSGYYNSPEETTPQTENREI